MIIRSNIEKLIIENKKRADELVMANEELAFEYKEKEKRADELAIANKELAFQNKEKEKRADELAIANKELAFQNKEKEKRADELVIANEELAFQNKEKEKRADELAIANKELAFQNKEKEKRADELVIANEELAFQYKEKGKRADELAIANKELAFQNKEKEKRADELAIANEELAFQNKEKEKRADELVIANEELAFQNKEKGKRADELEIANEELEQFAHANKELKQFAFIASHELKEPLRTIGNYIQVIKEDSLDKIDKKTGEYLQRIDSSTKRMSMLINSLLHFSRLGVNRNLSNIDCGEIINSVLSDLTNLIKSSNATISVSEMPKLDVFETEFRQLFQNLISNAIKFHKKGSFPTIQIRSEKINEHYQFSVSDDGIGIDSKYHDRIFDLFQRLDNAGEVFEGTGIGLAYCKKIVQMHQGEIWIESEVGTGSTFYFTVFLKLSK